nr:NBS-LRR resistance-like protein [Tanacetum cinerariifolium]
MEARAASLSLNRITVLKVEWDDESDDGSREQIARKEVLDALKPYEDTLKKLVIVNYLGLGFPKWVGDPPFYQLARVSIRGCKKYTSLPPLGNLQSLKELSIQDMDDVKVVGSVVFGTGLAFPSVESLSFQNMSRWEVWSISNSRSGVGDSVFPCLKRLDIEGEKDEEYNYGSNLLTSFRSLKGGGHKLKSVTIVVCKKLSLLNEELGERREKNRVLTIWKQFPRDSNTSPPSNISPFTSTRNIVAFTSKFGNIGVSKFERTTSNIVAFTFKFGHKKMSRSERKMQ